MNSDKDQKQPVKREDKTARVSPSAAKLQEILGDSPGCRNLTPYEIELLRKSKREMDQVVGEILAREKDASQS